MKRDADQTLRLPPWRELLRVAGGALLLGVLAWFLGVDVWHAILVGCAAMVGITAFLVGGAPEIRDLSWRPRYRNTEGARSELANLAHSLRPQRGVVGLAAERRLRDLAARRLALHGLDLQSAADREATERLIGTRAYQLLVRPDATRRAKLRTVIRCLDLLDALDSDHYSAPRPDSRRRPALTRPIRRPRER